MRDARPTPYALSGPAVTVDTAASGPGPALSKADLQIHTVAGDGMAEIPELLEHVETTTDLKVIAVTDHDSLEGAEQAFNEWSRRTYSFEVVMGEEVTTLEGHLLALWIERPIRSMQSLAKTLEAIHAQGGLAIVPHPFSWLTRSVGQHGIDRIRKIGTDGVHIDGFEVCNGSIAGALRKSQATRLNRDLYGFAETGGSDAHFLLAVGNSFTMFPGTTAHALRMAIERRQTVAYSGPRVRWRDLGLRQILLQQMRGLMVTPRNVVGRPVSRTLRKWWE